jgi:hypothetical protein
MKWVFFLALVLGSAAASACPPGPCNKYRRFNPPPVPVPVVNTYVRTVRAEPPHFSTRAITAFLTGSTWDAFHPAPTAVAIPHLRFYEAATIKRTAVVNERVVLVREIRQDQDLAVVSIDGDEFAMYRCMDAARHYTACLTRYVAN